MSWLLIALLAVPALGALALLAARPATAALPDGAASGRAVGGSAQDAADRSAREAATGRSGRAVGRSALDAAADRSTTLVGLVASGVTLAIAVAIAIVFDYGAAGRMQLQLDWAWIPGLDLRFHLGIDGISLPLMVLTALLTFLCFGYLMGQPTARPRALAFTLLVLEIGMLGTFLALDLLLFFVFFEVVLIPMYFVIAIWGGHDRRAAAVKFILYTLLGSAVLLLGLLVIWAQTGTLDMVDLAARHGQGIARTPQILAFLAVGLGLAVKTPMWPLHTWLPDAHTEAPTVGSVLLAGVLLKMGTYGFARIAIPILPEGAAAVAPWLGAFAVIGIIYGSLACLAQRDLKRMIAYSSVGHMGFVLLGFATLTPVGINAALFANIAHGLITGLLFFLAGAIKERYGTADMPALGGGMLARLPHLGSLLTFACIASLGLPGLAGFWGEMLALLGAYQPAAGQSRPLFLVFMAFGGIGTVLTAAYFLVMLSRITHGRPREELATAVLEPPITPLPDEEDLDTLAVITHHTAAVGASASHATAGGAGASGAPDAPGAPDAGAPDAAEGAGAPAPHAAAAGHGADVGPGAAEEYGAAEEHGSVGGRGSVGGHGSAGGDGHPVPALVPTADVRAFELAAWVPLVVLTLVFGLWPKALLSLTDPAVQLLLGAGR